MICRRTREKTKKKKMMIVWLEVCWIVRKHKIQKHLHISLAGSPVVSQTIVARQNLDILVVK